MYSMYPAMGHKLQLTSGNLIAVPVPTEHEADPESMKTAIHKATHEAKYSDGYIEIYVLNS